MGKTLTVVTATTRPTLHSRALPLGMKATFLRPAFRVLGFSPGLMAPWCRIGGTFTVPMTFTTLTATALRRGCTRPMFTFAASAGILMPLMRSTLVMFAISVTLHLGTMIFTKRTHTTRVPGGETAAILRQATSV
jgi:hypothetical protein